MAQMQEAKFDIRACPRCGSPIRKGQMTEKVCINGEAFARWVHVGCETPRATPPRSTIQRIERPEVKSGNNGTGTQTMPPLKAEAKPQGPTVNMAVLQQVIEEALAESVTDLEERLAKTVTARLAGDVMVRVQERLEEPMMALINKGVDRAVQDLGKFLAPKEIILKRPDGEGTRLKNEVLHYKALEVLEHVEDREDVFLPGPTGSGKTHLARQVAKLAKLKFGMVSCSKGMSEGHLTGRLIPRGKQGQFEYIATVLVDIYEGGGLFLFDEIDGADANVLLSINAALANGVLSVPNRANLPDGVTMAEYLAALDAYDWETAEEPFQYQGYGPYAVRHQDFVALAAANTYGTGADRQYVGRDPLDLSTRDRFITGTVPIDYDRKIEAALCPFKDILEACWAWRDAIRKNDIQRAMSTRTIIKFAKKRRRRSWTIDRMAQVFFGGWSSDEIMQVYGGELPPVRENNGFSLED